MILEIEPKLNLTLVLIQKLKRWIRFIPKDVKNLAFEKSPLVRI